MNCCLYFLLKDIFARLIFFLFFWFLLFCNNILAAVNYINTQDAEEVRKRYNYTSAIVANATTGEILYAYNANARIIPASLTKMMTAYIVFDAIRKGKIGINDKIDAKYTTKVNFKNDTTIKDLLYKMIINSINEVTDVLAEESCASVENFILKMNKFAKRFSMLDTNFANTNGLYDVNHYSTAYDMLKLSIRLVYDFPQYSELFGITNYIDENGEYNTKTTQIQENFSGIDGCKTGYLDASGYNMSAWGKHGKDYIFIVIIGTNSKSDRDNSVIKMMSLVLQNKDLSLNDKSQNGNFLEKILHFFRIVND